MRAQDRPIKLRRRSSHAYSALSLCLTWLLLLALSACERGATKAASQDSAFKALSAKQRVLLKKVMSSYDQLYVATQSKRLAEMQLYAGALSEAAGSVQFSLDLESSGALAIARLSAQQITLTRSSEEASQQLEDLAAGLITLSERFPSLMEGRPKRSCQLKGGGATLTGLQGRGATGQGAPYLHKSCP